MLKTVTRGAVLWALLGSLHAAPAYATESEFCKSLRPILGAAPDFKSLQGTALAGGAMYSSKQMLSGANECYVYPEISEFQCHWKLFDAEEGELVKGALLGEVQSCLGTTAKMEGGGMSLFLTKDSRAQLAVIVMGANVNIQIRPAMDELKTKSLN